MKNTCTYGLTPPDLSGYAATPGCLQASNTESGCYGNGASVLQEARQASFPRDGEPLALHPGTRTCQEVDSDPC